MAAQSSVMIELSNVSQSLRNSRATPHGIRISPEPPILTVCRDPKCPSMRQSGRFRSGKHAGGGTERFRSPILPPEGSVSLSHLKHFLEQC